MHTTKPPKPQCWIDLFKFLVKNIFQDLFQLDINTAFELGEKLLLYSAFNTTSEM